MAEKKTFTASEVEVLKKIAKVGAQAEQGAVEAKAALLRGIERARKSKKNATKFVSDLGDFLSKWRP